MDDSKIRFDKKSRDDLIRLVFDGKPIHAAPPKSGGPSGYIDMDSGAYVFIDGSGRMQKRSKSVVKDLCRASGVTPPNPFPGIHNFYDPQAKPGMYIAPPASYFNSYRPSKFQVKGSAIGKGEFPVISKIVKNIFIDQVSRDAFLNWLAVVFNDCKKTGTAWVIMGPQGSGKNSLYSRIILPLLDSGNCRLLTQDNLETRYNQLMADRQLVCFNEVKASPKAQDRLKTWITEDEIVIEEKRVSSVVKTNPVNLMFISNDRVPVLIDPDDRRFSVVETGPPLRDLSWFRGQDTLTKIASELRHFAWFLKYYAYDVEASHIPLVNDTKQNLIEKSMNSFQVFAKRLKANDAAWIIGQIDSGKYSAAELSDLSGFTGRLRKELVVKVFNDLFQESASTTLLTQKLKELGFENSRGATKSDTRKREYTWSS
ncbi:MAG: hypothetical protein ISR95_00370 [Candidatus Marinimicrobia bacterium]|nr:hypothetical protein [Candidatus Neomarinimicrobiota bacterium]MBL7046085.1 hypothetical protein [Candidatus Neomarinimicrobiota bacterium]